MSKSNIEWTKETWNPLTGCDKLSAGCKNCYAIRMAWRLMHSPHKAIADKYAGTVYKTDGGNLNWTGKINTLFIELDKPLHQKQPTLYFVNSMSDLFHEKVPVSFIADVFAVMMLTPRHTYQVLTKRTERMQHILNDELFYSELWGSVQQIAGKEMTYEEVFSKMPLQNVWLGTSVEDQKQADVRIPHLLKTSAAVRFLSCEPLLGPVDLSGYMAVCLLLHWVIAGGESGHNARPMHPDWIRYLRDQCETANVPFFFKQWGEYWPGEKGRLYHEKSVDFTDGQPMVRIGKKAAGSKLDGKEHKAYPKSFADAETI
jgi:protein gp37